MGFPTTSAPTLSNWQAQYGNNGLIIGYNTSFDILKIDGLDMPVVRNGDTNRPREHGQWIGLDLYAGRDLVITGDFIATGTLESTANTAGADLSWGSNSVGGQTEQPLWIQLPNLPVLAVMCRVRKRTTPIDLAYSVGAMAQMTLQFHAVDPRLYTGPSTGSCSTGAPLFGGIFPATFNYTFTSGSVAGVITADNTGNFDTRPILTLTGPLTNPTIENATTGWTLTYNASIAAGNTVVIDTDTHAVTGYTGGTGAGASVRGNILAGSTWPNTPTGVDGLAPGNNTIQLTSTGGSGDTGTLAVQWASAYVL